MLIDVSQLTMTPLPNTGSQIERAVIGLLKAAFIQANLPGLGVDTITFAFSNCGINPRTLPLIDVLAHKSTENPPHTRNESFIVKIEAEWPGANQPNQSNKDFNWIQVNNLIGVVMSALSQTEPSTDVSAGARVTAALVTQAGRALAVDESNGEDAGAALDARNNADMVNFTCDFVEFKGSQRAEETPGGIINKEVRNFEIRACPANVD